METLEEARAYLKEHWGKGVECPCCRQHVKLYKRKIYARLAYDLISLHNLDRENNLFFHVRDIGLPEAGGGDFAKLKHWGLVEEKPNEDDEKRTSGYWRITPRGRAFVRNVIPVEKYLFFYNGRIYKCSDEHQSIIEALGKKFNDGELMRPVEVRHV